MDGTLIRTTAALHLGEWLGHKDVIADLDRRCMAGEITTAAVADGIAAYYADILVADVASQMATVPCISGIREGVDLLRARGILPVIATMSWSFAAQCLADRFGFAAVSGAQMEQADGVLSGRVTAYFDGDDKAAFVRDLCSERGVAMRSVVAVGDSSSDIPLFKAVGYSVALNASPAAQEAASVAVDSDDFVDALRAVPGLI
jgi:phosphoserine phosphatase